MPTATLTPSARELRRTLKEGGPEAERIRERFHRITRWKWVNGRGLPDAASLAWLHDVTGGRIAANGWTHERRTSAA